LPAESTARTKKVCVPSPNPVYLCGELHAPYAPPSRLHSKPTPCAEDENVKLAEVSLVRDLGPESMLVSGGVLAGGTVRFGSEKLAK